jgi:hypothetical protein
MMSSKLLQGRVCSAEEIEEVREGDAASFYNRSQALKQARWCPIGRCTRDLKKA